MLVEKIREVNALIGFTRLEAPEELLRGDDDLTYAPLSINPPEWVPANEVRGEGILLRFQPDVIAEWEQRKAVQAHLASTRDGQRRAGVPRDASTPRAATRVTGTC